MIFQLGIPIFRNFLEDEEGKEQDQDTTRLGKIQEADIGDLKLDPQDSLRLGLIKEAELSDMTATLEEFEGRRSIREEAIRREQIAEFQRTGDVGGLPEDIAREIGQAQAAFAPDILGTAINRARDRSVVEAIGDMTPAVLPLLLAGTPGAILGMLAADEEGRKLFDPEVPLPPQNLDEILDEGIARAQAGHEGFSLPSGLRTGVALSEQEMIDIIGVADPTGQLATEEMQVEGFFSSRGGVLGATVRATLSLNRQFEEDALGTMFQLVSAPLVLGYLGAKEALQTVPIARGPITRGFDEETGDFTIRAPEEADPFRFRLEELRQRFFNSIGRMTPYEQAEARRGMTALLATAAFGAAVQAGIGPGNIFRRTFAKRITRRGTLRVHQGLDDVLGEAAGGLSTTETIQALHQFGGVEGLEKALGFSASLTAGVAQTERFLNAAGGLATFGFFSAAPGEKLNRATTFAMSAIGLYGTLALFDWGLGPRAYVGVSSPKNPARAHAVARLQAARPFDQSTGPIPDISVDTGRIPVGTSLIVREVAPLADLTPAGGEASIVTPAPRPRTGPNTTLDYVGSPDYVLRRSEEEVARMQTRRIGDPRIPDPAPISSSAVERMRNRGLVRAAMIPGERRVPPSVEDPAGVSEEIRTGIQRFVDIAAEQNAFPGLLGSQAELLTSQLFSERVARATSVEEVIGAIRQAAPSIPQENADVMGTDIFEKVEDARSLVSGRRMTERRDIVENARRREVAGIRRDVGVVVNALRGLLSPELADVMLSDEFILEIQTAAGQGVAELRAVVSRALTDDIVLRQAELSPEAQTTIVNELVSRIAEAALERAVSESLEMASIAESGATPTGVPPDRPGVIAGGRTGVQRRAGEGRRGAGQDVERREGPETLIPPEDFDILDLSDPRSVVLFALRRAQGNKAAASDIIKEGFIPGLARPPRTQIEVERGVPDPVAVTRAALELLESEGRGQEIVEVFLEHQVIERRAPGGGREISRSDILAFEAGLLSPEQLESMAAQAEIEQRSVQVEILGEEGASEFDALQDIVDTGTNAEKEIAQFQLGEVLSGLDPNMRARIEGISRSDDFGIDLLDAGRLRALANIRTAHSFDALEGLDQIELIDIIKTEVVENTTRTGLKGAESFIRFEGALQVLVTSRAQGGKGLTLNDIGELVSAQIVSETELILEDAQRLMARRSADVVRAMRRIENIPHRVNAPEPLVPANIAEDAAIWFQNDGDPIGALIDQVRTKVNQSVIIRGLDTPGRALELIRTRLGEGIAIAIYERPSGLFDVGIGGEGSPFQLPNLKIQFEAEGNFAGQEISVDGTPYEYISRGKRTLGEDPNNVIVRTDPNGLPFPIARILIRNIRDVKTINEFDKVAITQRGLPEKAALRIRDAEISQTYTWLAEHIGDLTRIMSEAIVVVKGDFSKSIVTVDRMLEQLQDVQGTLIKINQEIAENSIVRSRPGITEAARTALVEARRLETVTESRSTLHPTERHDLSRIKQLGRDYSAFHKQIPTINRVQRLAQDAAVAIGEFRLDLALDRLRLLQAELGKGRDNWAKVTAESTTPTLKQVMERILDPEELKAHEGLQNQLRPPTAQQLLEDGTRNTLENMRKLAATNGLILDKNPSGGYTLRDQTGGGDVFSSPNIRAVEEFIANAGQLQESVNYDAAHGIDPNVPGSTTPPPPANARPGDTFPVEPEGYLESLIETAVAGLPWLAPFRDYAAATDATTGTKIFRQVWLPTNLKAFESAAQAEPGLKELEKLNNAIIKAKVTRQRWESLRTALTTRSEAQLRASHLEGGSFVKHRDMNPIELALGDQLIALNVSMQRVHNYLDTLLGEWKNAASNLGVEIRDIPTEVADQIDRRIINELNVTPQEVEAMKIFMVIRNADVADISGYGVERLVTAHRDGSLSPEDYMNQENFTPEERGFVEEYRRLYDQVAADPRVPISDSQLLLGYEAHVGWRQKASPENAFNGQPGGDQEMRFIHNMIRQGEGNPYDQNPTINLANYIRAAYRAASGFNDAWSKANRYVQTLPEGQTKAVAESYLGAVRGNLPWEARQTQKLFDAWVKKMGWEGKINISIRNDVINSILAINSGALIGFRYGLTLRDLTSWLSFHYARFGGSPKAGPFKISQLVESMGIGPARTIRALELGFKNFFNTASELRKSGVIPSVGPIQFETPNELMASGLGRELLRLPKRLRDIATFGFVMGGQKNMYEALFTGTYLESKEFVGEASLLFQQNKITKPEFYETIKLNAFNKQVRAEFDELVNLEKFDEANEFLARMSGIDMLGLYGMANHPWGWGTNPGRMAAQYGNWPASMLQTFLGGMTRGSPSRQLGFATRMFMGQGAMWATGKTFGLDFGSWFIFPGLFFLGGPLVQVAEDFVTVYASNAPDTVKNRAKGSLRRFWPEVDLDDMRNTDFRTMWFPTSYFINDYIQARNASKEGKPFVQAMGRFFNIPISKKPSIYFDGATFFNQ